MFNKVLVASVLMYVFLLEIFGVVGLSFASLRRPIATVALKRLHINEIVFFKVLVIYQHYIGLVLW